MKRRKPRQKKAAKLPDLNDPKVQKRLKLSLKRWDEATKHLVEDIRDSERITGDDLRIRINARDYD